METKDKQARRSHWKDFDSLGSNLPKPPDPGTDQPVDNVFAFKLKLLAEAIQEIDRAIAARKVLNHKFHSQIEKEIEEIKYNLGFLQPPWKVGFHPKVEFIRISLQKSMCSRKSNKRAEELKLWEHVLRLVQERRKLIMEYQELLNAQSKLRGEPE